MLHLHAFSLSQPLRWRSWRQHCFLNFMLRVIAYSLNLCSNTLIVVTIFILYPLSSTWFCSFHTASKVRAICSELCSCSSFDERLVLFTLASGSITNFAMSSLQVIKIRSKCRPQLHPNRIVLATWHLMNLWILDSESSWHKVQLVSI